MKISELENIIAEVFTNTKVKSVTTVYEKAEDPTQLKLVVSLKNLTFDDTIIIHTKFIFKVNKEKTDLVSDTFLYLREINCYYKKVMFDNAVDLKKKIENIVESNDFGKDIISLSTFIEETPITSINKYLAKNEVTSYSLLNIIYNPKFKVEPCDSLTFEFDLDLSGFTNIKLKIKKEENETVDYTFTYKYMDKSKLFVASNIEDIASIIANNLTEILENSL